MVGPRRLSGALVVHFQGRQVAVLRPGNPAFTFGRGDDRTLRFGHDSIHGGPDLHISRHAGSIRYGGGLWVVYNDSERRPFDVIVRGVPNPLPSRTAWVGGARSCRNSASPGSAVATTLTSWAASCSRGDSCAKRTASSCAPTARSHLRA